MATSFLKSELTDELVRALLSLENADECYAVLEDLCTVREVRDLSQRLAVARLLRAGTTYTEIVEKTGASTATIGRVNRALNYGAGGYASILNKLYDKERKE
jgi:TrpR-related protein YerC/YecD